MKKKSLKRIVESRFMSSQREKAYNRDRQQCVLCNTRPATVHEIEYRSARRPYDPETFRLSNLVTLCAECHQNWHNKKSFREEAIKRLEYLIPKE